MVLLQAYCAVFKPLYQGSKILSFLQSTNLASPIGNEFVCLRSMAIQVRGITCIPRQDHALLCALSDHPNAKIANTIAFKHHLWCLSKTLIAFAFFDDAVTVEDKGFG